jgi:peptidyl-Lys metalloendopeptidase
MKLQLNDWMLRTREIVRGFFVVFLILQPTGAFALLPAEISLSIRADKAAYSNQDDVVLTLEYTNTSDYEVRFLKWGTGLDGRIGKGLLDLKFQGQSLPYAGMMIKRIPPTAADHITLYAGEAVSTTVSLSSGFDINLKGQYSLERLGSGYELKSPTLVTESAVFQLNEDKPVYLTKRPPAFTECTSNQESQIDQALSAAESIARNSADSIRDTPTSLRNTAARYKEWFGVYAQNRWNKVQSNFDNIYDATANRIVGFDCSCDDLDSDGKPVNYQSTFAYVYPNDHYNMNVCGQFWAAQLTGTDSRAGTIIHELSHFDIVAATNDDVYGQDAARSLAKSNPNRAIANADSHEYFAENTPFESMPKPSDLVIASNTVSDLTPRVGQTVTISGTIANQGDGESPSTSLILSLLGVSNSPQINQIAVPVIDQGSNFNFQLVFEAPSVAGEYATELCVSAVDGESNTNNNCSVLSPLFVKDRPIVIAPIIELILDD